jgi:hypothetical protein
LRCDADLEGRRIPPDPGSEGEAQHRAGAKQPMADAGLHQLEIPPAPSMPRLAVPPMRTSRVPRAARASRSTRMTRSSRNAGAISATTVSQFCRRKATWQGRG